MDQVREKHNLLVKWIIQDEYDLFTAALEYINDVNKIFMLEFYNTTLLLYTLKNRANRTISFVNVLLQKGANINMKSELSSPIHEAVISGDLDLVRFMLENRAMPSLEIIFRDNPLNKKQLHVDPICQLLLHQIEKVDYIESVISLFQQYGWEPSKRTVRSLFHNFDKKIKHGDWTKICLMVFLQNKERNSVYDRMILNPQKREKSIIFKCLQIMSTFNFTGPEFAQLVEVIKIVVSNMNKNLINRKEFHNNFSNWVMRP